MGGTWNPRWRADTTIRSRQEAKEKQEEEVLEVIQTHNTSHLSPNTMGVVAMPILPHTRIQGDISIITYQEPELLQSATSYSWK